MNLNIDNAIKEGRALASEDKHRYCLRSDDLCAIISASGASFSDTGFILAYNAYCVGLLRGFRKGKKQASKQASKH